jgi:gliding motility-associated-like protein
MKYTILLLSSIFVSFIGFSQMGDCADELSYACSNPDFQLSTNGDDYEDFMPGTTSSGCLNTADNNINFFIVQVMTSGTLEWSVTGVDATGFLDWAIWPYVVAPGGGPSTSCTQLLNGNLAPVACNWNTNSAGLAGMASPGNMPPGGMAGNFEDPLMVTAGQTFLLGISDYSSTGQQVALDFFGTGDVSSCQTGAPDQTICIGTSTTVTISTPGLVDPQFQWLVTTGVASPTSGTSVVTPMVTTTYQVEVTDVANFYVDTTIFTITVVSPPLPNAGIDDTVCFGEAIHLSGYESYAPNTTNWSAVVPPAMIPAAYASYAPNSSSLTPTVTVNQPGLYKFVLRETNPVCGVARDTVLVLVSQQTQTVTKVDPSCAGYADGQIVITSPTAVDYSFDGGSTWQTSNTQGGFLAGTYTVCSRNSLGCQRCGPIALLNPDPALVTVSNDTLICENGTATLVATGGGNGTSFTYVWGHTASTSGTQPVSPTVATYYPVASRNQNGCLSEADSIYVAIRSGLSGEISPDVTICPGYPRDVTAVASGGIGAPYTYVWTPTYEYTGTTSTISANPPITQVYSVEMRDGCESTPITRSMTVTVAPVPDPQFVVDVDKECEPAVFELVNTTDPAMSSHTYWELSDGQIYSEQDTVITSEMMAGMYNVQLIVASPDGCIDSVTYIHFLNSHPQPVADFRYSPNPVKMFNTTVNFTNYSYDGVSYEWTFNGGTPGYSAQEDVTVLFPDGVVGEYDVRLITTSEYGCLDTMDQVLVVFPEVILYAPNAFTPDGDEYNQTWGIHMEGIDPYDFQLLIFNRWGEVVWESHEIQAEWDGTYGGQVLPAGAYNWAIRAKDAINDAVYEYNGHMVLLR